MRRKLIILITAVLVPAVIISVWFSGSDSSYAESLQRSEMLSVIPDRTVEQLPGAPTSPQYIVLHRSSLNGMAIRVQGVIVDASLGSEDAKIFLSGGKKPDRQTAYDLPVFVGEEARPGDYLIGQQIIIRGVVRGSSREVYVDAYETEPLRLFSE